MLACQSKYTIMPKVSVVVPNYNHALYLNKRLNSIISQTWQDFEIIILDDKSLDNSVEIIKAFDYGNHGHKIILNDKNSGSPFIQWNKGIAEARGEYIWIAESDDKADSAFLETLVNMLDTNPDTGIAFCQSVEIDKDDKELGMFRFYDAIFERSFTMNGLTFVKEYMSHTNNVPNASAVLFRKSLFDKIDDSFKNFRYSGDWMIWIKMLILTNVSFIKKPLNYYRQHTNNVRSSLNYLKLVKENNTILEFLGDNFYSNEKEKIAFFNFVKTKEGFFKSIEKGLLWEIYRGDIRKAIPQIYLQAKRDKKYSFWIKNSLYWLKRRITEKKTSV
jgi:glycosyltransferase involved in cell wall biosynthesis